MKNTAVPIRETRGSSCTKSTAALGAFRVSGPERLPDQCSSNEAMVSGAKCSSAFGR